MHAEVSLQVVLQTKSDPTRLADERFFPRVHDPVLHQSSLQLERLAAVGACERAVVRVHSPVGEQMSRRPETLPTGGTRERFLPGVNGAVLLQYALCGESFPAGVADKRADSGVDSLVSFQQTDLAVCLLTDGALKGFVLFVTLTPRFLTFLLCCSFHFVRLQVSLESLLLVEVFVTLVAGERLVVAAHVLLQLVPVVETFAAFLTKDSFLLMLLRPPPVFLLAVKA